MSRQDPTTNTFSTTVYTTPNNRAALVEMPITHASVRI